jgi:hemerythrin
LRIEWRDQMAIDHGLIDQDHRALIGIVNDFVALEGSLDTMAKIGRILDKLQLYTATHFDREQYLRRMVQFPYCEAHEREHQALLRGLNSVIADLAVVQTQDAFLQWRGGMDQFLHHWLVDHIIQSDLRLKPYVKALRPHADGMRTLQQTLER